MKRESFGESSSNNSLEVEIPSYFDPAKLCDLVKQRNHESGRPSWVVLIVIGNANQLNDVSLLRIKIRIADGRFENAGPFERVLIHPSGPHALPPAPVVAYRYTFPK
jgi:hypothetical protein